MIDSEPLISIICPACNEEQNLEPLYQQLSAVLNAAQVSWEFVVVDDHSADDTFQVISRLAAADYRVHGVRLSRNFGSHAAKMCGVRRARGQCAILMAADLQDPPELIPDMLAGWRAGAQVVRARRTDRPGEKASTVWASHAYLWLMRNVVGLKDLKPGSSTYILLDRPVMDTIGRCTENSLAINALVSWMGFRTVEVPYVQQPRLHGESKWTLHKKVGLLFDSVIGHSFLPVRLLAVAGAVLAGLGLAGGVWVAVRAYSAGMAPGWEAIAALLLVLAGMQMAMMGMLGEYLWRTLMETRRRPQYVVEEETNNDKPDREICP
jgi:polyisoprenyl-phosphate glycosyltransferase